MSSRYRLNDVQVERLKPFFPKATAGRALMTGGC